MSRRRTVTLLLLISAALSSCYHLPLWHGEVKVTPREREALKKCGDGALTDDGTAALTRGPYLQSTTTTSVIVVWAARDGRGDVVLSEPGGAAVATVVGTADGRSDVRKAVFTGLKPTHLYCYQLVANGKPLTALAPLNTASAPGLPEDNPFRFVALGDTGTGGAAQKAINARMSAEPFEMMLFLGDLAYEEGTAAQLENNFFGIYRDVIRYVPAYPTIGNHERLTAKGAAYFAAFVLPEPERYYSFDWGDVHFVAIDTTQRDSEQLRWLAKDLAATKQPWKIVYGHHPMYSNSLRGAQQWIRRSFSKILTDANVDLVLTGHEHHYERFRVAGVNYVISGGGGGQLTRIYGSSRALRQATVHHFLAFEVTATKLTMRAIDINGNEIDHLVLDKKGPPAPSQPLPVEKQIIPDEKVHDEPDNDRAEHPNGDIPEKPRGSPDAPTDAGPPAD
ncbi:MAG TPA: metallophosphoesterase [Kofleriaceae bacterium]|jgi:predicted phosphodiesterase